MRVGLVFGGRSVEHVVSVRSAKTVREGLLQAGHDVTALGIAENGAWLSPQASTAALLAGEKSLPVPDGALPHSLHHLLDALKSPGLDVLFPIVHGTYGEDGTLQGLFEMLGIAYVGCGVAASAIAMDKLAAKRLFEAVGLPVVPYVAITRRAFATARAASLDRAHKLGEPLFVKPSVGGSSVGCRQVATRAHLEAAVAFALQFDDVVIVEKGLSAREVEVAVLGELGELAASALGEIVPGKDFYDYEDKYLKDDAKLLAPAPVDDAMAARLKTMAIAAMDAIGGAGLARVDFFVDKRTSEVFLNEINTLPGFTNVSMYPRLWALSGVALPQLCDRLLHIAVKRAADRRALDAGVRAFVASVS